MADASAKSDGWLAKQSIEISTIFAMRKALRTLPALGFVTYSGVGGNLEYIRKGGRPLFSIFNTLALSWIACRYGTNDQLDRIIKRDLDSVLKLARNARKKFTRIEVNFSEHFEGDRKEEIDPYMDDLSIYGEIAADATIISASYALAAGKIIDSTIESNAIVRYTLDSSFQRCYYDAEWNDVKKIRDGIPAIELGNSALWPEQNSMHWRIGWNRFEAELPDADGWGVWKRWYDLRIEGVIEDETRERAYILIPEEIQAEGAKAANAEVARRLIRAGIDVILPPSLPLPANNAATQFIVENNIVDVLPSGAWASTPERAKLYFARCIDLADKLTEGLTGANAEQELLEAVIGLRGTLGHDLMRLEPDQLRIAARSVSARALAYGHPAAGWEISPKLVSQLFELNNALIDLQGFAARDLQANDIAIRQLGIDRSKLHQIEQALQLITEIIVKMPDNIAEDVSRIFEAAAVASKNAINEAVQLDVEGGRTLIVENLALSIIGALRENENDDVPSNDAASTTKDPADLEAKTKTKRRPTSRATGKRRTTPCKSKEDDWSHFSGRIVDRLNKKGPDQIADATLQAITSTIKHSPKSIPALAGLLYASIATSSGLVALGGGISITLAWLGFELMKRK